MAEDGEDPDPRSGDRPGTATETCTTCGAAIETDEWYPVTSERDDDGSVRLYPFCSEACRDAWLEECPE